VASLLSRGVHIIGSWKDQTIRDSAKYFFCVFPFLGRIGFSVGPPMSHVVDANKGVMIFFSREPVVRYRSGKTLKYRTCENIFCVIDHSESDVWCICDVLESNLEF
jgi:hypothetical protein